jgi:ribosomal protein S18 acetylase RimI-like enzyme
MASSSIAELDIRLARLSDVDDIAQAHRDSIQSLGQAFYPPKDVEAWQEGLTGDVYRRAMQGGEVFFVATGRVDGTTLVLGFASDYRLESAIHGTSAYVRAIAARRGVGSALLRRAEEHAVAHGARTIQIEASLAGVEFYRANGYQEVRRGETRLKSGHPIACVFMRKELADART